MTARCTWTCACTCTRAGMLEPGHVCCIDYCMARCAALATGERRRRALGRGSGVYVGSSNIYMWTMSDHQEERPNHRPHGTLGARPECHHTHAVVASWHHLAYNTEYDTRQRYCIYILERSTHPTGPDESTRPHDLTARRDPTRVETERPDRSRSRECPVRRRDRPRRESNHPIITRFDRC